jgi:hypothetical protein
LAEPVVEALGATISDLLEDVLRRARPRAHAALDWLRTTATPPPHVILQSADGTLYTGCVIVERNRPVIMFAVRHEMSSEVAKAIVTPPGSTSTRSSYYQDESHRWREGDDVPFWRR